jgi:transposase
MLSKWRKQAKEGLIVAQAIEIVDLNKEIAAELKELRQLKDDYERLKENHERLKEDHERLKIEHGLLKEAIAFTSTRKGAYLPSSSTAKKRIR